MATERKRRRGFKRVQLPTGEIVRVPVITDIAFIDPRDRYQETIYKVDNSEKALRTVHVDDVRPSSGDGTEEPLKVERIDVWKILDPRDRYQEHRVKFDNVTGAETVPPHFTTHLRTHVYRYYQDPYNGDPNGPWIDSELIDKISTVDPVARYQKTTSTLVNPAAGDMAGQADPNNDPDITIGEVEGTADNPVRLDPFQNIVDFWKAPEETSSSCGMIRWGWSWPTGGDTTYLFNVAIVWGPGDLLIHNPPGSGFPDVSGTGMIGQACVSPYDGNASYGLLLDGNWTQCFLQFSRASLGDHKADAYNMLLKLKQASDEATIDPTSVTNPLSLSFQSDCPVDPPTA